MSLYSPPCHSHTLCPLHLPLSSLVFPLPSAQGRLREKGIGTAFLLRPPAILPNLTIYGDCCFFPDWILIKPICLQTSDHQPILVALCPGEPASFLLSGAPLLPGVLVTTCLWNFCGSETRMGLVLQGRGLGDCGGANALLGACR